MNCQHFAEVASRVIRHRPVDLARRARFDAYPQIENAFRHLVAISGGTILKPSRYGGFNYITLGEILYDPIIKEIFGEDATFYFSILLTDQRGFNIRNNVCHGISDISSFNQQYADLIMHVLFCLSIVRDVE